MAILAGPGQGLPPPQALYPNSLFTTSFTAPTNQVELQAGQALTVPAGTWIVGGGVVSALQWLDPVSGQWTNMTEIGAAWAMQVRSDGFNYRIANLSGAASGATVSAPGTGYVQSTTVVNPDAGNSTWKAVVGGALGAVTMTAPGANYSIPPIVFVPAPPTPGVAATGIAAVTGGAVTGVTWTNPGAGYSTPPKVLLIPSPYDPNLEMIQNAAATVVLTGAGTVTAVLLQNAAAAQAAEPTLAIAGQGSGATATVLPAAWVAPADDQITMQPGSGG